MSFCSRLSSLRSMMKAVSLRLFFGKHVNVPLRGVALDGLRIRIHGGGRILIGKGFRCRSGVVFNVSAGGEIAVGEGVFINDGCSLNARSRIRIGSGTLLGQNVLMYDHDHDYKDADQMQTAYTSADIDIGQNVWIGSGVIILKGTKIGDQCVIGAGSVVKGVIPADMLAYNKRELVINPRR